MSSALLFPVFRKLSNNKAFYKINSLNDFEEIKLMGKKVLYHRIEARIFPEKLKITDLLSFVDEHYLDSDESEWNQYLVKISA